MSVRADLLSLGRQAVEEWLAPLPELSSPWERMSIWLVGSASTEYADVHSSLDLFVLVPDGLHATIREVLAGDWERPGSRMRKGRGRYRITVVPEGEFGRKLRTYDDTALSLLRHAAILHDPPGRHQALLREHWPLPPEVWRSKLADRYAQFRLRRASLAWSLRRGQPFVVLDNLVRLLAHALTICFYLDGEPPMNRKWLLRGALRTRTGNRLRPLLFELFSSLGEVATLGGSFHMRHNRLYLLVGRLQERIEEALREGDVATQPGEAEAELPEE